MWQAGKLAAEDLSKAIRPVTAALGLGIGFVAIQGVEWARLLADGLSMQASPYGSFFFLIVGAHAIHAVVAIVLLGIATRRLRAGELGRDAFTALRAFWYFVVGVWPVLYWQVYL